MSRCLIFLMVLLVLDSQCGVMQITLNNLRNVLTTYGQLVILFHNPQCPHSRKYVESFLKIDSSQKLGIVDCLREIQLCNKYNYTNFPILSNFGPNDFTQVVNEQQLLVDNGLKDGTEDQVMVNKFVQYLERDSSYAVVVFEHYGLPTIKSQRISQSDQNILYLQPYNEQNPSNFTQLISSFVHNKPGCWIFKKSASNQLEKYYCDGGYNKTVTLRYINLFKEGKIKKFTFTQQDTISKDQSVKQYAALDVYNILDNLNRVDTSICALIYVASSHCPSCNTKDIRNVQWVLKSLKIDHQVHVGKFDIDQNQIPTKLVNLGLKRVPELVYICNQKVKVFGEVFFLENVKQFLQKHHLGKSQEISAKTVQEQNPTVQSQASDQNL